MTANGLAKRLAALEAASRRTREKPGWVRPIEDMADADPLAFGVWRVAFVLAQRRAVAEARPVPRPAADSWDAWDPLIDAELERFAAVGWDAWLAEGDALPPLAGWPVGAEALAAFFQDEHARTAKDAADARDHLVRLGWRSP